MKKSLSKKYYQALLAKDQAFEGVFIAGVRTTGIFCRPTCRARKPAFKNVEFFKDAALAAASGYRPCKICRPLDLPVEHSPDFMQDLSRRILSQPDERITDDIMRKIGYAPATVRRWFKKNYSITFHAWQRMVRLNAARQEIRAGYNVTSSAYNSGYESLSGFGKSFKNAMGTMPSRPAAQKIITARVIETPLGPLLACAMDEGICLLQFMDQRILHAEVVTLCSKWKARLVYGEHAHIKQLEEELARYFRRDQLAFSVPLAIQGTPFQRKAWLALRKIPYGKSISYQEQAHLLGSPGAVRAAGTANRLNRIVIVIPCHRVIGKDGDLCGFGGGLWRKKWLLEFEKNAGSRVIASKRLRAI
jgi:AraC family transcriptional regulator of adaptative response/methylated-DNA-[protein]-cysteine methyltransferase